VVHGLGAGGGGSRRDCIGGCQVGGGHGGCCSRRGTALEHFDGDVDAYLLLLGGAGCS
jgi:hypothetical protein